MDPPDIFNRDDQESRLPFAAVGRAAGVVNVPGNRLHPGLTLRALMRRLTLNEHVGSIACGQLNRHRATTAHSSNAGSSIAPVSNSRNACIVCGNVRPAMV